MNGLTPVGELAAATIKSCGNCLGMVWCPECEDRRDDLASAIDRIAKARADAAVRAALGAVGEQIHRDLWRQGDRETRRRSYPAGVAWRSAANVAERIVRAAADTT